jgi:hypothetical protein
LGALNKEVQASEMEDERKERLIEKLKDCHEAIEGQTKKKI